jgi:hypothetical protein
MRTIVTFFWILLLGIVVVSCEKGDEDKQNDTLPEIVYNYVLAGDSIFNVDYFRLEPEKRLVPPYEPFYVWDSIDLDHDSIYDFKFYIAGTSNDQLGYGFWADIFPINNRNEIAYSYVNNYPDTLNLNDTIDSRLNWKSGGIGLLTYQKDNSDYEGNWTNQMNKFLAIRLISQDTNYGWIRMDVNHWGDLVIYDYGLMKK